jgi:LuxR family maltose regulon positive regulatory protein
MMTGAMNNEINILLVDDHAVLRKGLAGLLAEVPGIRVVGEASDGEEAITQVRALKPDLVVMDISMPKLNGIQATRQITTEFPETKVIALSMHSGKRFIDDMLGAGAVGYLLKESAPEELIHCIRVVLQGDTYLSNVINDTIVSAYVDQISNQHAEDSEATFDILQSKLRRPAPAPSLILRTQLLENLDAGRVRPLTLVSAPAGYGKTVLVNTWLESGDWPRTWLLLEKSDSDLRQFVSYFVAAINNIFPTACENTIRLTSAPILPSVSSFATSLSNELDLINEPFHLVLDDYQCIDSMSPVQDLINQLLAHPPVPLHLVLLTRRDPPISLVVLRAQDQITEIRMHDLMFDISETRQLIQDTTSLDLTNNELNKVHFQLEGWPVGLRFLIWSMRQAGDSKQILGDLQGSGHQVREYLLHEVINQQSAQMQHWLLRTSILDKLCPALCDVVCSADDSEQPHDLDGQQFLDTLHRENFFVFALPSHADWFRYHRVFQDALREQLAHRIEPDQIASLHLRASAWFESQGLIKEAMQHALLAQNPIAAMEIAGRHQREELNKESWHIVFPTRSASDLCHSRKG